MKNLIETYNTLNNNYNEVSKISSSMDWRNEDVRLSDEFKAADKNTKKAFQELRAFNKTTTKEFKKAMSKARRAAWKTA